MPIVSPLRGGFTEGELRVASFWVRRRVQIERWVRIGLVVLILLTWAYVIWTLLDAYVISFPRESQLTQEIAQNQLDLEGLNRDQPQGLQTDSVAVFQNTDDRIDLAMDLANTNEQWWAEFRYRFNVSGETTLWRSGFIMPTTKSVLTEIGFKPKTRGGTSAQLEVDNLRWHRVDPTFVGGLRYTDFALNRFNVRFDAITYDTTLVIGTKTIGRSSFDVINRGAFGFWSTDLVIKLKRGNTVVGVSRVTVERLQPGEKRHIELDWFEAIPQVTQTEIIPMVNLLDQDSYLQTEQFRGR